MSWHPPLKQITEAGFEPAAVNRIKVKSRMLLAPDHFKLPRPAQLHPFCQQREILDYCQKNGITLEAHSPLIQAGRGMFDHPIVTATADEHGKDNTQILIDLIRWTLQKVYGPPIQLFGCSDCGDFADGLPSQKPPTQNESSSMRLFVILSWRRRI